jgi:probable HAF family extracellular repeat protein
MGIRTLRVALTVAAAACSALAAGGAAVVAGGAAAGASANSSAASASTKGAGGWPVAVRELPPLGGKAEGGAAQGIGISDRGWVTGSANLPGDTITHAVLWRRGRITDLGTLGGDNSAVPFLSHSNRTVTGVAETAAVNPDGESWSCNAFFVGAPSRHDCRGFIWHDGHLTALPTLGGPNGFAAASDRRGDVAGWAENRVADPTCVAPQVRQFRAVRWGALSHRPHQLAPLPGDSTSAAVAINDHGLVVGISGACGIAVGGVSAAHAVWWDGHGRPHEMGTLGGSQWNTPDAVNDHGLVVGFANVPGGASPASLHPHAFAWTARGGMRDLGTLPHDDLSEALGVNDRGQITGESCHGTLSLSACSAVLWQGGHIYDLGALTGRPRLHLSNAGDISDSGVITGTVVDGSRIRAYLATVHHAR